MAALAALIVAWLAVPAAVPIYDSGNFADEPYRYANPPAGSQQKALPTPATATMAVRNGVNTAAFANSQEVGPQISVYIPAGSLKAPDGATSITITASPSAPVPPLPKDGPIVTNVYTVTATASGGGTVTVIGTGDNQTPTLQMRAPTAKQPGPTFETRVDGGWKRAQTVRVGQDIYQTFAPQLGVWALVQGKVSAAAGGGMSTTQVVLLVVGIAILAIVGIIVLIRIVRSRSAPPAGAPARRGTGARR